MTGPTATTVRVQLGWTYRRVNGSAVAHLVPPRPGRLALTACHRIRLAGAVIEEPRGLLTEVELCRGCVRAEA